MRVVPGVVLVVVGVLVACGGGCGGAPAASDAPSAPVDGARTDGGGTTADGALAPDGTGLADAPTEPIADANAGSAMTIGTTTPQAEGSFSAGYLLGVELVVPTTVTLRSLGVFSYADGTSAWLSVYTDVGGAPSARVAVAGPLALTVGANEIAVTPVVLPPGTYWFMASYGSDASIGQGGIETDRQRYAYVAWAFADSPPTVYPVGVAFYDSGLANYWLAVD